LRAGTVKEILSYKQSAENQAVARFVYDEVEYQTANVVRFKVLDFNTGEEISGEFEYFNVRAKGAPAKEFKIGERYVFQTDWLGVEPYGKGSYKYKLNFIRPGGFVKLYADSKEEIELFKKAGKFDEFKELLGVEKDEAIMGGVIGGKAASLPKPNYPQDAPKLKNRETVKVLVLIGENGTVLKAKAVCAAHQSLAAAAEQAARAAKFSPTIVKNQPVKVKGFIFYNFVP